MNIQDRLSFRVLVAMLLMLFGCKPEPQPITPEEELIARGRVLFFNEAFSGNGRTCGTCHPAENNFALDATFIATLPPNNPLFVAEFKPELKENFENPRLMREFGLILKSRRVRRFAEQVHHAWHPSCPWTPLFDRESSK
jgi:hypothetical protein